MGPQVAVYLSEFFDVQLKPKQIWKEVVVRSRTNRQCPSFAPAAFVNAGQDPRLFAGEVSDLILG